MANDQNTNQQNTDQTSEEQPVAEDIKSEDQEVTEPAEQNVAEPENQGDSNVNESQPEEESTESTDQPVAEEQPQPTEETAAPVQTESETNSETIEKQDEDSEQKEVPAETSEEEAPITGPRPRWYVVHTYSGHENRVATTLKQRVESEHLGDKIVDILVPTQEKIEIRSGKKETVKEKIFPGYILVKMLLDDDSWTAVRTTQGVTSFVGMGNKPTAISDAEVQTIVKFMQQEDQPTYKQIFSEGDTVKIVDGPFAEFIGKIDNVDKEKGKVKVLVSIFGRETPVELDFLQVAKL